MDLTLLQYIAADPLFYESPTRVQCTQESLLTVAEKRDWSAWERIESAPWVHWHPRGARLPAQGWKVHVSTTPDHAETTLHQVSTFCHEGALTFKHLARRTDVHAINSKDADRAGAGKFITIYPEDDDRLLSTLTGLDALLGGQPGPYVLSDLRFSEGPLYVRYGAFTPQWTRDALGRRVPAMRDPNGVLVEDRRTAAFTPPPWAPMPAFLREQVAALGDDGPPPDFGYTITQVMHYSNAGGVYAAHADDGVRVVLKEGRAHTGLTPDGRDAVTRLRDEEDRLRQLAGPNVVAVHSTLTLHEHRFLALHHVNGTLLNRAVTGRTPLVRGDATSADRREYQAWTLRVSQRLDDAVARIHAAGYVHGDLHPGNVMVTPDDEVVLLDFEMARPIGRHDMALIGAPGFVAPDRRGGLAGDRYALACLKIFMFCPLTPLFDLDPAKADDILRHPRMTHQLDPSWLDSVRHDLALDTPQRIHRVSRRTRLPDKAIRWWRLRNAAEIDDARRLIGRSLCQAADYARADRLWPGDPRQFAEDGFSLAHGASGVIHALDAAGLDIDDQALEWLDEAINLNTVKPGARAGLLDGLAGAGWTLRQLGHHGAAEKILEQVRSTSRDEMGPDLYGGLAGVGLYLLSEAADRPEFFDDATDIARRLRQHQDDRPLVDPAAPSVSTDHGGLLWGATGTALFALRLYEHSGDRSHLQLATDALDHDLAHCVSADDNSLQMNEGWRLMPYLATGSAGTGLVAAQLIAHADDPETYRHALAAITRAACAPFTIEPGLFYGRAGFVHYLIALAELGVDTPESNQALTAHVEGLALHALRHGSGIGFPGRGLLRISCDLATGSAGVLTALNAYSSHLTDDPRMRCLLPVPLILPTPPSTAPALLGEPHTLGRR